MEQKTVVDLDAMLDCLAVHEYTSDKIEHAVKEIKYALKSGGSCKVIS